ncbi:hypothetical protein D3C72_1154730 [compost metagenome]
MLTDGTVWRPDIDMSACRIIRYGEYVVGLIGTWSPALANANFEQQQSTNGQSYPE